jgi:hypothetical protein
MPLGGERSGPQGEVARAGPVGEWSGPQREVARAGPFGDDAAVVRRAFVIAGGVLSGLGLLAGAAALALPWARYRARGSVVGAGGLTRDGAWQVYQLDLGQVYVVALLVLAGLLAAGGLGAGTARKVSGIAAPILGFATALLVVYLVNRATAPHEIEAAGFAHLRVDPRVAAGAGFGMAAAALLGFGAGLLAVGRTPDAAGTGRPA